MSIRKGFAFPRPGQPPAGDLDSTDALAGLSATRDSAGDFRRAQAAASGEMPGGGAGFELEAGELKTTGGVDDPQEFSTTTGGDDQFAVHDMLPQDSNAQAGGQSV